MYEYADKILEFLRKQFINEFGKMNALASFDELNVLQKSKGLYADMEALVEKMFLLIAQHAYEAAGGIDYSLINEQWIIELLEEYDPVTKYVYSHEVDRKAMRFAESLIASATKSKEVDTALKYWAAMVSQYAVTVTDSATISAFKSRGVKKVRWITQIDGRQCSVCDKRNGNVYDIDDIPPKPHIGCRCYYAAVE